MKITPTRNKQSGKDGYTLDCTVDNRRVRLWVPTVQEAKAAHASLVLEKRNRKLGIGLPKKKRRVEIVDLFRAHEQASRYRKAWDQSCSNLFEFFSHLPPDILVEEINTEHLLGYVEVLRQRKLNNNTINKYLSTVRAWLNSMSRHFPDVKYQTPSIPFVPPELTTDRVLSGPEIATLYQRLCNPASLGKYEGKSACQRRLDSIADLFLVCGLTGARPSEVLSLTWTAIHFEAETFRLNATKTGDRRILPLTASLKAVFQRRLVTHKTAPFENLNSATVRLDLINLANATNIPYGERTGWTLKTLRHTAITIMLSEGADLLSVSEIAGHTHAPSHARGSMTFHYAHVSMAGMRRAMELLDAYWQRACRDFKGQGCHLDQKMVQQSRNK